MRKLLAVLSLSVAMLSGGGAGFAADEKPKVKTGYEVAGCTWYYQDRDQHNKVVQVCDLNDIKEIYKAMKDPAHPKSMVRGDGGGGGDSGGN